MREIQPAAIAIVPEYVGQIRRDRSDRMVLVGTEWVLQHLQQRKWKVMGNETPRQRAGRANQKKSRGITPEGREVLRQAALANRPWECSTGPTSEEGKARSSRNARKHGLRAHLVQLRSYRAELRNLETMMALLSDDDIRMLVRDAERRGIRPKGKLTWIP